MSTKLLHAFLISATLILSFILTRSNLVNTDLAIAIISIIFIFVRQLSPLGKHQMFDAFCMTLIVTFVVESTGAITSPLFFLLYFLVFALSLLLEPVISISASLTLTVIYVFFAGVSSFSQAVPLLAFPFLVPFALFLGEEYHRVRKLQNTNRLLQRNVKFEEQEYDSLLSSVQKQLSVLERLIREFGGDHEREQLIKQVGEIKRMIMNHET